MMSDVDVFYNVDVDARDHIGSRNANDVNPEILLVDMFKNLGPL